MQVIRQPTSGVASNQQRQRQRRRPVWKPERPASKYRPAIRAAHWYIAAVQGYDVIVVGGGAAGLMCALTAGQRGRRVLVLEGSNRIGKKILMSGGGRCNFTNLHCEPDNFLSANSHFCISALRRYTQWDFIALVEKHAVPYHEKTLGQLFCDRSSKDIVALLATECEQAKVHIVTDSAIGQIEDQGDGFKLHYRGGSVVTQSLVIASGGLSIPKMGASGFGYDVARQYDIPVLETRAGLVPFTFAGKTKALTEELSGVSVNASVSVAERAFDEAILFTHRGLSGPAALQISNYWQPGATLAIDLVPAHDLATELVAAKQIGSQRKLRSVFAEHLPRALVDRLQALFFADLADVPLNQVANDRLHAVSQALSRWELKPSGTEGYRTAEVTLGGVDTRYLSSQTMEARHRPGLYFIGEVLDVTGHLGGFNFQWAWASGHAAGQVV